MSKQIEIVPQSEPKVICILLNWNGWQDTVMCLRSLSCIAYTNLSIIVVDNGSTDQSVNQIRSSYPNVEILETGQNLGFAGGNNQGIKLALERQAEYVWLLNNDTAVTAGTLGALISTAKSDAKLGQIGSVLFYMNRRDQVQAWGGGKVNVWTGKTKHFRQPVKWSEIGYLTAASVLVPSKVLGQVGLLDQDYFMYWEDTDLSYRIRSAGWTLGVAENAIVFHKESASSEGNSPKLDRCMTASAVRFLKRFAPVPWVPIVAMILMRLIKRLILFQWRRGWAVVAGLSGY